MGVSKDYRSPEWLELRATRLALDDYRCCGCNRTADEFQSPLEVHHRTYATGSENPLIVPIRELITLCPECHEAITNIRRRHIYSLKPVVENKGVKRNTPNTKTEVLSNGVQDIKVQDYGRATVIDAQWRVGESSKSFLEGDKGCIVKTK